jgi:serine/threonine protein phosphatase PrpC/CRP-like cAMP-binding protein
MFLHNGIKNQYETMKSYLQGDTPDNIKKVTSILEKIMNDTNAQIYAMAEEKDAPGNMGTTVSAFFICQGKGFIIHVGDSRIYLLRKGYIHQMTEDHSMVHQFLKEGKLEEEELELTPFKNMLTRAIGIFPQVEVDAFHFNIIPGDQFLICSDGLHGYFEKDSDIAEILSTYAKDEKPKQFIKFAKEAGGRDNITAVCVEITSPGQTAEEEVSAELFEFSMNTLKSVPLYKDLEYKELVRIYNITKVKKFAAGQMVLKEGEKAGKLFIILSGKVEVSHYNKPYKIMKDGTHFAEMSLIDNQPASLSVKTLQETTFLIIQREDFLQLLQSDSVLAAKLLWRFLFVISYRLRDMTEKYAELKQAYDELQSKQIETPIVLVPESD